MARKVPLALLLAAACGTTPVEQDPPAPAPGAQPSAVAPAMPGTAVTVPPAMPPPPMPPTMTPVPPPPPAACADPGATPLRHLTSTELVNTVQDLVGFAPELPPALRMDQSWWGSFDRVNAVRPPQSSVIGAWMELAERTAARATADLGRLLPCAAGDRTDACAERFVDVFGKRAFRRPLDGAERALFAGLFRQGRDALDFAEGVRWALEGMLQAPQFLYHVTVGEAPSPGATTVRLTAHELAARLSYTLWGTLPDERLSAAADAGPLDAAAIRREAERMLADPRGRRGIAHFNKQWLALDQIEDVAKDDRTVPFYTAAFRTALRESAERFVDHVVWEDGGKLETLLRAPYMFAHPAGEPQRYGLAVPPGTAMVKATPPAGQRAGVLSQPALLALNAWSTLSNPVTRGAFVLRQVLCVDLPAPPADIALPPPPDPTAKTTRERLTQHSTSPACAACHRMIDPLGFAFESFDGLGIHRTMEAGKPIDASGVIRGGAREVPFTDLQDFTAKLSSMDEPRACASKQWLRYGLGREAEEADRCTLETLRGRLVDGGGDLRTLFLALTETPAFVSRRVIQGGTP